VIFRVNVGKYSYMEHLGMGNGKLMDNSWKIDG
jgi:hypothetical protein